MVAVAQKAAKAAGVSDKATFEKADIFESDFSKAQIITMFLLPWINEKLAPKLLEMKPGTRVVSNTFTMATGRPTRPRRLPRTARTTARRSCGSCRPRLAERATRRGRAQARAEVSDADRHARPDPDHGRPGAWDRGELQRRRCEVQTGKIDGNSMSGSVAGGRNGNWTARRSSTRRHQSEVQGPASPTPALYVCPRCSCCRLQVT
jgi:hypothetical protein